MQCAGAASGNHRVRGILNRSQFYRYIEPIPVLLALVALLLLMGEISSIENTILGWHLVLWAFVIGAGAGFIPGALFGMCCNHLLAGLVGRVVRTLRFAGTVSLAAGLAFVVGASVSNREFAAAPHQVHVVISDKALGGKGHTPYLYFAVAPGVSERIMVDRTFYDSVAAGADIVLTLERGYWGYEVVRSWDAKTAQGHAVAKLSV